MPSLVIGVVGDGRATGEVAELAWQVGKAIAKAGAIVLTGGGGGVMQAAYKGANSVDGMTISILPFDKPQELGYCASCTIYTGLKDARNYVNAYTSDAFIALAGGPGTLSEIALALKIRRKVVCLRSWGNIGRDLGNPSNLLFEEEPDQAVRKAIDLAERRNSHYPDLPGQTQQKIDCEGFLGTVGRKPT